MTYTGSVFTFITRSRFYNRGVLTLKMTCFLSYLEHFGTVTQRFFWIQNPDQRTEIFICAFGFCLQKRWVMVLPFGFYFQSLPWSFGSKIQVRQSTVMQQTLIFPFFSNLVPPIFQLFQLCFKIWTEFKIRVLSKI